MKTYLSGLYIYVFILLTQSINQLPSNNSYVISQKLTLVFHCLLELNLALKNAQEGIFLPQCFEFQPFPQNEEKKRLIFFSAEETDNFR